MKQFLVLAALIAVVAGSALPLIPGDNSHYIQGVSRYIWMPDSDGKHQLVDLEAPVDEELIASRAGANQYWLYTRSNRDSKQVLVHGNAASVRSSHYDGKKPLKVIVHGWNNDGNSDINSLIRSAFLEKQDCNVIMVDWSHLSKNPNYVTAANGVPGVGDSLGQFLTWLISTGGGNWNTVHLVGHSLGAHVVGNAGRAAAGNPARVTGMDPAGPLFGGTGSLASRALNTRSGQHVESIHTDGGVFGIFDPISHADFYPNGGRNPQPGCAISTCSHSRSKELFAASVRNDHLIGRQCANINQAKSVSCTGASLSMGNGNLTKKGNGLYGLKTGSKAPF